MTETLTIARPDDWHLHLRDGEAMRSVVGFTADVFGRALVMPNLKPPVTTAEAAVAYRQRILDALPDDTRFKPWMTLYLTDTTTPEDVVAAKESGIVLAFKLYPAGATTHSDAGVKDIEGLAPTFREMASQGIPLCVHGEVTDPDVDIFDREGRFLETFGAAVLEAHPDLKLVVEHMTTKQAVDFVRAGGANVAGTLTPQHLLLNRNALFEGGLRPHHYCLPVLKRESHRVALVEAATSGEAQFFLGTDSAPHTLGAKEAACGCAGCFTAPHALSLYAEVFEAAGALDKLEGFASHHGPDFYGLPRATDTVTLVKTPQPVPLQVGFADDVVVPLRAGGEVAWSVRA